MNSESDSEFITHHSSLIATLGIVVANEIDPFRDRVGGHQFRWVGSENIQPGALVGVIVQPKRLVFGAQDDRHAIVDRLHQLVRSGCDNREGT